MSPPAIHCCTPLASQECQLSKLKHSSTHNNKQKSQLNLSPSPPLAQQGIIANNYCQCQTLPLLPRGHNPALLLASATTCPPLPECTTLPRVPCSSPPECHNPALPPTRVPHPAPHRPPSATTLSILPPAPSATTLPSPPRECHNPAPPPPECHNLLPSSHECTTLPLLPPASATTPVPPPPPRVPQPLPSPPRECHNLCPSSLASATTPSPSPPECHNLPSPRECHNPCPPPPPPSATTPAPLPRECHNLCPSSSRVPQPLPLLPPPRVPQPLSLLPPPECHNPCPSSPRVPQPLPPPSRVPQPLPLLPPECHNPAPPPPPECHNPAPPPPPPSATTPAPPPPSATIPAPPPPRVPQPLPPPPPRVPQPLPLLSPRVPQPLPPKVRQPFECVKLGAGKNISSPPLRRALIPFTEPGRSASFVSPQGPARCTARYQGIRQTVYGYAVYCHQNPEAHISVSNYTH
ncbi:hypothetical protein C7M84_015979 [Penaeus vannamei]|uniref:Uncharacterized protein n=1 Tax=Penaeus vannamei TaxID=6689 RepID=A0A3R7M384_PENVA|nr:hypothetical protein C7M84_015979 [Penaeus vannamei]